MISALGRPFDLGMLYDRRSDKLILGKTLWSPKHLKTACKILEMPSTNSKVFTEDTIGVKASALDVHANQKLNFLCGLVNVEGAARYLNDTKTSKRQSRVVLKYETTTELKQITKEHLRTGKIDYPEVFDEDIATDVVAGILYGANAFMIFDKEVRKNEYLKEVDGKMTVLVHSLLEISASRQGSVDITEEQKKYTENMRCKMYGDFRTNENPTNYENAVQIYKQLPSLIGLNGEKAVPIGVFLYPLSNICSKCQRMVREISADLVSKTTDILEHIKFFIAECDEMAREEVCVLFPRLRNQLLKFKKSVDFYQKKLQKKILSVLPKIRGGEAEEIELGKIIQEKEGSPFSYTDIKCWLEDKRNEIKRLQAIIHSLEETPVVSQQTVENELSNPNNEYVVCCSFKIGCEEDDQILRMDAYNSDEPQNAGATSSTLKTDKKSTHSNDHETLRHFKILQSVNKENSAVIFFARAEPPSRDFQGNSGVFLYFCKDEEIQNEDLRSSPKPINLREIATEETALQLCYDNSAENVTSYKVQYKKEDSTETWSSVHVETNEDRQTIVLSGLKPATKYIIRICAVKEIIVSEYSDEFRTITKPSSPPGKPQLIEATSDALKISFAKPQHVGEDVQITNYKVEWSSDASWSKISEKYTTDATPTFTLKDLKPLTSYFFKVSANCGDAGESNTSPTSEQFTTAKIQTFQLEKILGLCNLVEPPEDNKPAVYIYALPLTLVHDDSDRQLRKYEINLQHKGNSTRVFNSQNKVIMMVGSTGSGKTTAVDAMINHILGVEWKDNFRLKMIHEDSSNQGTENIGNQTCSQTQFVTCYTLHHLEGFKVPYTLTIVDTPGFGDTRGIKHDEKITEQIRTFFNTNGVDGIDHIDAICFVAQAGIPRLTPTQSYVFDKILSMFGKDIQKNIFVLFTFADGQKPQALASLQKAGILEDKKKYCKFNNSALFVDNSDQNDDTNFDKMFWSMGITSFKKFFKSLNEMETRSLVLTKEVLKERAQLEVKVSGLKVKMNLGINTLSRLQQEQRIFDQHAVDINANRNFKYTVSEERRVQSPLEAGTYTTNCTPCNYTCHFPCSIPRTEDKANCNAMTNGNCRECPNRCHWSHHINDQYRVKTELVEVEKEYDSKKTSYQEALEGKTKAEALIDQLQAEFIQTEEIVLTFVAEMQRGLQRLSEIALKKDPLQQVDYLDLLIESEKSQAKSGFKDRIRALQETRDRAEQINSLARPGYDPWKQYRENEETRKFLQSSKLKSKMWIRVKQVYDCAKSLLPYGNQ